MSKLNFLTSRRFWGLCLIAVVGVLGEQAVLSPEVTTAVVTIVLGFIGLRTVDRFSETVKS